MRAVIKDPVLQARRRALDDEFPVEATLLEEAEGQAVEKVRLSARESAFAFPRCDMSTS